MKFKRSNLVTEGFQGFFTVKELRSGEICHVPERGGVYIVLREIDRLPDFLDKNPAGRFNGKDPTVSKSKLESEWVNGAHSIYIGKANYPRLKNRITELIEFGSGKPIAHRGGRLVWQIDNSHNFIVAWKCVSERDDPEALESYLLDEFIAIYDSLPFANLKRGRK